MEPCTIPSMQKGELYYRPLEPRDFESLKEAHIKLFPIDYEDSFFSKAVRGLSQIFTLGAFEVKLGHESLVGFVTARLGPLNDVNPEDRRHMDLSDESWNRTLSAYILTLGVIPEYQNQGIACTLISQLESRAASLGAKIIFLHVITYNTVALRLYHRCKFQLFATLKNFYSIHSGRQPDPTRTHWDAHLFSKFVLDEYGEHGGVANLDAVSQLKSAWSTCWPFACRQYLVSQLNKGNIHKSESLRLRCNHVRSSGDVLRWLFGRGKAN